MGVIGIKYPPYDLPEEDRVRLLGGLLLAWDGQWFLKTVEEFGLEAGVRLNGRVRSSFGRIEMKAMLKALGKEQADSIEDAIRIITTYSRMLLGPGYQTDIAREDNSLEALI